MPHRAFRAPVETGEMLRMKEPNDEGLLLSRASLERKTYHVREMTMPRRLIVGMTGATGTVMAVRLLEMLRDTDVETHLVMSRWAARTLVHESSYTVEQVEALATRTHPLNDQGASIASGSFLTI